METIRSAALLLSLLFASASLAAKEAPDVLLRNATSEIQASLRQDAELANDPSKLDGLINAKVVPVFDFSRMAQLAMARNWRLASARQQDRLTAEFKAMLLRTYSATLASYRDKVITYKTSRFVPGDTDATVRSEVKQGAKVHKLDYEMTRTPEGWKVYDVKLNDISLVTAYRQGFTAKVRDSGVDGLIRALAEKNRQSIALAKGST
jgi:phospholipid transport system substrate-binding protein